jgi:hypothetical protein
MTELSSSGCDRRQRPGGYGILRRTTASACTLGAATAGARGTAGGVLEGGSTLRSPPTDTTGSREQRGLARTINAKADDQST